MVTSAPSSRRRSLLTAVDNERVQPKKKRRSQDALTIEESQQLYYSEIQNKLPKHHTSKERNKTRVLSVQKECAICLEEIQPTARIFKLNCNHEYHEDCLQPWLNRNHVTCPLDQGKITSINGTDV